MTANKQLIDFETARRNVLNILNGKVSTVVATRVCLAMKDASVDAVEVVHGRWGEKVDMVESYLADCKEVFYECSVCQAPNLGESNYCPNCGAKMDGGNDDGKSTSAE